MRKYSNCYVTKNHSRPIVDAVELFKMAEITQTNMDKHVLKKKMEELLKRHSGPGPAKYALPGTIGITTRDPRLTRSPAFSFGQRNEIQSATYSPGPKYFIKANSTRCGIQTTPRFSLYSRPAELKPPGFPGPGTYLPGKHYPPHENRAPSFSFGMRTEYRKRDKMPAPNSYTIPVMIGPRAISMPSSPAYSLNGRPTRGGFSEDLKKTPGPGTYKIISTNLYRTNQPKYSLKGRNFMPGDRTKRPGPGIYSPEKVTIAKRSAPAFSFGIKHAAHVVLPI